MSKDLYLKMSNEDILLLEGLLQKYSKEDVIRALKRLTKKDVMALVAAGILTHPSVDKLINGDHRPFEKKVDKIENVIKTNKDSENKKSSNPYDMSEEDYQLFKEKVSAVKKEISRILPMHGFSPDSIKFDPKDMVLACYYGNNFPLDLMIAQARMETNFGKTGVGKSCNSLFSIGAYDNDPTRVKFNDCTNSIYNYVKIVNKDYLMNGQRTKDDLLNNYVNKDGLRYASLKTYEDNLRTIVKQLNKMYPVLQVPFKYS